MIEYLRLVFATALVLAPGAAVARALGRRSPAALLAWGTAAVFVAWAVVFSVHSSIRLAALVLAAIFVAAVVVGRRLGRRRDQGERGAALPWVVGIPLGWFLWHVAGVVSGDGLFHEARVRKLVVLGDLHLRTVDEFKDGGLHPGYAFPLWHGFLALVSWLSGVDAGNVIRHEPSVLAPLACALAYQAGVAVLGSRAGGVSLLLLSLAIFCFGAGHGGSYAELAQPATSSRQLYVPAALVLFFASASRADRLALAVVFGALALVHPTYAIFLLVPLAGYAVLRFRDWREWGTGFAAALVPVGLALVWLKPLIDETVSHDPSAVERRRAIRQYADQLVVTNEHHYRLAAQVFGRSGAVAVAGLIVLPLAATALRRPWAAYVLGGGLAVLLLLEVPWLFVHFSNAVSLSQSRRAAGFAPLPFAVAGGAALLARTMFVLPAALIGGIVLQSLWPGDFEYGLHHGGPAWATWIALLGGTLALAVGLVLRRDDARERPGVGAAAVALFVLPVFLHGAWHWSPRVPTDSAGLSPRLIQNLRAKVPAGAIVIAPIQTSYRVVAAAPVYVVALPVVHVADTVANAPYRRARDVRHWVLTSDPRVPRRYGATWAIRGGRLYRLPR